MDFYFLNNQTRTSKYGVLLLTDIVIGLSNSGMVKIWAVGDVEKKAKLLLCVNMLVVFE